MTRQLLIVLPLLFLAVSPASAWHAWECGGSLSNGLKSSERVYINRCSAPVGSTRELDILEAIDGWERYAGMEMRFALPAYSLNDCTISNSDDKFEIGFVGANDLDGARAVTKKRIRACGAGVIADGRLLEADIWVLANDDWDYWSTGTPRYCGQEKLLRQGTIADELGHVLGMEHENDVMSLMYSASSHTNSHGPYCVGSGHTRGRIAPHPDDLAFIKEYHSSGVTQQFFNDVAASGFQFVGGVRRSTFTGPTMYVCPGDTINFAWSFAVRGTLGVASAQQVMGEIALTDGTSVAWNSTRIPIATGWSAWGNFGYFGTFGSSFRVPTGLSPNKRYFVMGKWDTLNAWGEVDESNNSVLLDRSFFVKTDC